MNYTTGKTLPLSTNDNHKAFFYAITSIVRKCRKVIIEDHGDVDKMAVQIMELLPQFAVPVSYMTNDKRVANLKVSLKQVEDVLTEVKLMVLSYSEGEDQTIDNDIKSLIILGEELLTEGQYHDREYDIFKFIVLTLMANLVKNHILKKKLAKDVLQGEGIDEHLLKLKLIYIKMLLALGSLTEISFEKREDRSYVMLGFSYTEREHSYNVHLPCIDEVVDNVKTELGKYYPDKIKGFSEKLSEMKRI